MTAQTVCETYTIQPGDTLRAINLRAYGNDRYRNLHDANRIVIGPVPHRLEVGQVIRIPCLDGTLPPGTEGDAILSLQPRADAPDTPTSTSTSAAVVLSPLERNARIVPTSPTASARTTPKPREHSEIRFLTAGNLQPFVDRNRRGGGLLPELIDKAMRLTAPGESYRVDFVDDRQAQLEVLLPLGAFDLAFPWFKPDCTRGFDLSDRDQILCDDYVFSDTIYTIRTVVYTTQDNVALINDTGLVQGQVCVPGDYIGPDPKAGSLVHQNARIVKAKDTSTCLRKLGSTAEYVLTNADLADGEEVNSFIRLTGQVRTLEMAVAALKSNGSAVARLALFNAGLRQVTNSSEWQGVVAAEIAGYRGRP